MNAGDPSHGAIFRVPASGERPGARNGGKQSKTLRSRDVRARPALSRGPSARGAKYKPLRANFAAARGLAVVRNSYHPRDDRFALSRRRMDSLSLFALWTPGDLVGRASRRGDAASRGTSPRPGVTRSDVTPPARRHWQRAAASDGAGRLSLLPASHAQRPTAAAAIIWPYYATVEIRIDFGAGFCLLGPASCSSSSAIIWSCRDPRNR